MRKTVKMRPSCYAAAYFSTSTSIFSNFEYCLHQGYDYGNPESIGLQHISFIEQKIVVKDWLCIDIIKLVAGGGFLEHTRQNDLKGRIITFDHDAPETFLSTPNLDTKGSLVMTFVGLQRKFDEKRGCMLRG